MGSVLLVACLFAAAILSTVHAQQAFECATLKRADLRAKWDGAVCSYLPNTSSGIEKTACNFTSDYAWEHMGSALHCNGFPPESNFSKKIDKYVEWITASVLCYALKAENVTEAKIANTICRNMFWLDKMFCDGTVHKLWDDGIAKDIKFCNITGLEESEAPGDWICEMVDNVALRVLQSDAICSKMPQEVADCNAAANRLLDDNAFYQHCPGAPTPSVNPTDDEKMVKEVICTMNKGTLKDLETKANQGCGGMEHILEKMSCEQFMKTTFARLPSTCSVVTPAVELIVV